MPLETNILWSDTLVKEFWETRGLKFGKWSKEGKDYVFINLGSCPKLDPEKGCLIYDKRPVICRIYPTKYHEVLPNCQLKLQGLL